MSTLDDNGEGIIGQCVFIGGKPPAALETDHSLSVFPQVDVTTCVLPLSEHKRGLRCPPPHPLLSPLRFPNQNHLPPGPENRPGPPWTSLESRRAPLVWTNVGASTGARTWNVERCGESYPSRSLLPPTPSPVWARPWYFLITHRKLLLQRTLS